MNQSAEAAAALKIAEDSEVRAALERSLADFYATERRIVELKRQPSEYRSSFSLEELTAYLDGGERLSVMFKDLSFETLLETGKRAKPEFLYNPEREIEIYRKILSPERFGTAVCYGSNVDSQSGRYWLFLEKISGVELYQVGDLGVWEKAARWLAAFHGHFAHKINDLSANERLLKYDETLYREWMQRARTFFAGDEFAAAKEVREPLEWLEARFERVVERLAKIPQTFLHGEFYASNVLVRETRVCPVDWEMSGVGPCLIDLAALTAGGWGEKEKMALADAYYKALPQKNEWFSSETEFLESLQYCRLYLAAQWVGWFGRRRPFAAHAQDWLGEAVRLAGILGL